MLSKRAVAHGAATDSHLWADSFDRKLTDIFAVESDVANAIAAQLQVHLTGQEKQVIAATPTDNPEAYDAYLRGLAYTLRTQNTPANYLGAQKYFRIVARLGEPDRAIAALEKLLSIPGNGGLATGMPLTPALLRLGSNVRSAAERSALSKARRIFQSQVVSGIGTAVPFVTEDECAQLFE